MSDSDVVIRVEGLGKSYALHHEKSERYTALRDVVARQAKAAGRLLNPFTVAGQLRKAQRQAMQEHSESEEEFWALKDVSFEIRRGERVGIIGRNGAGKSTLLKILSRITEPTTGCVEIRGRVASLLEVGTGFHPELTGRENIFLNGAILGMTRREIRSKFDEIVAFAEVERFLDTPVKRYSSGMYVRLAFAVAAHLEPEILVVDEVLAVGDQEFQKKCLSRMENLSGDSEITVLFVSHNIGAIKRLCEKILFLQSGELAAWGQTEAVLSKFRSEASSGLCASYESSKVRNQFNHIAAARVEHRVSSGKSVLVASLDIKSPLANFDIEFHVFDCNEICIGWGMSCVRGALDASVTEDPSTPRVQFSIDTSFLATGDYAIRFLTTTNQSVVNDQTASLLRFEKYADMPNPSSIGMLQSWGHGSMYFESTTIKTLAGHPLH